MIARCARSKEPASSHVTFSGLTISTRRQRVILGISTLAFMVGTNLSVYADQAGGRVAATRQHFSFTILVRAVK